MKVRIRKDGDSYLSYFLDSARVVEVNEVGSMILDLLLNQGKERSEIIEKLSCEYESNTQDISRDFDTFLKEIEDQLSGNGFSVIDQKQLQAPFGAELEITDACNLRCAHCFQEDYSPETMPLDRACKILEIMSREGVCEVSVIGGEPLMHLGLIDILRFGASVDLSQSITTNATLLDDETISKIAEIPNVAVFASMDGTSEVHDRIRGQGVFAKLDRAIRGLIAHQVEVDIIFTLNAINIDCYKSALDYCESLGIACNFNLFKPFKPQHSALTIEPDRYFAIVLELFEMRRLGRQVGVSNAAIVGELLDLPSRNECTATLSGLVVDRQGRMITCPGLVSAGHYAGVDLPMFDERFVETWKNHETFCRFKQDGMRNCQVRSLLFGGSTTAVDPYGIEAFRDYRTRISQ